MKIGIVYASYDGILNSYCGVGSATRTFISSFESVHEYFQNSKIDLSLELITPALVPDSLGFSSLILQNSQKIARESGGNVHLITNASNGMIPYGDIENWTAISNTTASKVLDLAKKYDKVIFFAVDTPFIHAPRLIELQKKAFSVDNIISILTLHSDALIHEGKKASKERLEWESSGINYSNPNILIAETSKFLKEHLVKNYKVNKNKFVNLQSGVIPIGERYKKYSQKDIIAALQRYNVPLDKELIFSVGRAVPQKGFDLLIKALAQSRSRLHLVMIASPYKTEDSNVAELHSLIEKYQIDSTEIYKLDFELPTKICQWKNTKLVAQLSRSEPFGLVPEEVRLWAKETGPVVLASYRDGYVEQINDGIDGFLVNIENIKTIAEKIDYIMNLTNEELVEIKRQGNERALKEYDFRLSLFNSINSILNNKLSKENFTKELST